MKFYIPHIKSIILLLVGSAILCSFNTTSESTSAAHYTGNRDTLPCFLAISDIHLCSNTNQRQKDIPDKNGDTGYDLWNCAKQKLHELVLHNNPKFIIVTGDLVMHNIDSRQINSLTKNISDFLHDSLDKKIPLIIVPGNNDSKNGDYAFLDRTHLPYFIEDSNAVAYLKDAVDTLGSYSVYPLGKNAHFKIIVLNSIIFHVDANHPYKGSQKQDALSEIDWFTTQLRQAKIDADYVLIAMHIPPGVDGYNGSYLWSDTLGGRTPLQNTFLDSVYAYRENIIGLLSGHSHVDGIRLLIDSKDKTDKSKLAALLISVPGIAPGYGNNPSIKIVSYDPANKYKLKSFTTYYMNYWNAPENGSVKKWNDKSFHSKEVFDITGDASLLEAIRNKPTDSIQKYVKGIYYPLTPDKVSKCANPEKCIESTIYVTKN